MNGFLMRASFRPPGDSLGRWGHFELEMVMPASVGAGVALIRGVVLIDRRSTRGRTVSVSEAVSRGETAVDCVRHVAASATLQATWPPRSSRLSS